jgi:enhancing lycopene biosynthesis protein 2
MATRRVAVVLAGCGFLDGSEIHESVCTLLAIDRAGVRYQVFAPDKAQKDVIDHHRQRDTEETRNVLVEAARIARSDAKPLSGLKMEEFDALIMPGGYGAAKNLADYASAGAECGIDAHAERVLKEAHAMGKPIGAICIAPVIVARALGKEHRPVLTIGTDTTTAGDIEKMGGRHRVANATEIIVDEENRIVSTPAYMSARRISEVWDGISRLVDKVISMCR